jgi:hypothetical protein
MGVVPFISVGVARFLRRSGICPLMLLPSSGVSGRVELSCPRPLLVLSLLLC